MVRVVVADDSMLVREAIEHILDAEPAIELVQVSGDPESLLDAVERHRPDLVLTDIRMPPSHNGGGVDGASIDVADRLRDAYPDLRVIVLSQHVDARFALSLLEQGSSGRGYLLKDHLADRAELVSAIEAVADGGSVIDPKVVESLVAALASKETSRLDRLTPREREILAEVASGKSNGAIAQSLVITKRAVERHIGSIFGKLELPAETEVSRRVKATLLFLSERDTSQQ